jgi:hypothetical protein
MFSRIAKPPTTPVVKAASHDASTEASKVRKLLATSYLFLNIHFLKISDKSSTVQVVKQAGRQDK